MSCRAGLESLYDPLAKLSELTDALEFESVERRTNFDRHTGRIVSVADGILSAVEEDLENPAIYDIRLR